MSALAGAPLAQLSTSEHVGVIGEFYSRFPYPWRPARLHQALSDDFYPRFLSQDLGDYAHRRMPSQGRIWVAGCGTNQALITALRFPGCAVLGTDVSEESLAAGAENAAMLGVTNVELRSEPIGGRAYEQEFDLVVCTGVIHHNADPEQLLGHLRRSMRPTGVLELMVYNRFHRREAAAFQEATRILFGSAAADRDRQIGDSRRLAADVAGGNSLSRMLNAAAGYPDEHFADMWMNPYEQSFTVAELWAMADRCGLDIETPCGNRFDLSRECSGWEPTFTDPDLRRRAAELDDRQRWQLVNLLAMENSPMLWFYLRSQASDEPRLSEQDRDANFLSAVFHRAHAEQRTWVLQGDKRYAPLDRSTSVPTGKPKGAASEVYGAVDGTRPMYAVLAELGMPVAGPSVRHLRTQLATTLFPYLQAGEPS
jgi:SAM-dependent methyltransferase